MRAPLRATQGFADALIEDYGSSLDPTALSYLRQIENGGAAMTQLIDDLLEYSRLGQTALELRPIALMEAIEAAQKQLKAEGCHVTVDVVVGTEVMAHPQTLVQALANLLSNACKFVRIDWSQRTLAPLEKRPIVYAQL